MYVGHHQNVTDVIMIGRAASGPFGSRPTTESNHTKVGQ